MLSFIHGYPQVLVGVFFKTENETLIFNNGYTRLPGIPNSLRTTKVNSIGVAAVLFDPEKVSN